MHVQVEEYVFPHKDNAQLLLADNLSVVIHSLAQVYVDKDWNVIQSSNNVSQ
jgi:hypothetical protein